MSKVRNQPRAVLGLSSDGGEGRAVTDSKSVKNIRAKETKEWSKRKGKTSNSSESSDYAES